ncbi:transcriptional regulator, MarR family [Fibrisoma limi BUZ 3]|uniref:Transcriptional regulator, MarR family n=2 Tax=Fibrisoma limi TaxID=663275 RepID=I2GDW6_9BACT|nr:transcriptional regulator, MarR family [Fibrisoma limi BUZ 3]
MLVIPVNETRHTMNGPFRNQYHRLIANLHRTDGFIINYFQQKLSPHDLSVQQYSVLRRLQDVYPDSLTVSEVKERLADHNSDITRLIDRLVAKNLVVREVDEQNRRRVNLRLTDDANRFVGEVAQEFKDFESIVNHLTDEEVETLNILLDKIRNA